MAARIVAAMVILIGVALMVLGAEFGIRELIGSGVLVCTLGLWLAVRPSIGFMRACDAVGRFLSL